MLDKFQQLVSESDTACAVLGNPAQDRLELVNIEPLTADRASEFVRREDFLGVIGFVGFKTRTVLAVALDDRSITALSQALVALAEAAIDHLESEFRGMRRIQAWSELT